MFPSHLPVPQHIWYAEDHDFSLLFCQSFSEKQLLFCLFTVLHPPAFSPVLSVAIGRGTPAGVACCQQPSWSGSPCGQGLTPLLFRSSSFLELCSVPWQGAPLQSAPSGCSFPHLPTARREHQSLFPFLNWGRRGILGAGCGDPVMYQWKGKKEAIVGSNFDSSGFSFF